MTTEMERDNSNQDSTLASQQPASEMELDDENQNSSSASQQPASEMELDDKNQDSSSASQQPASEMELDNKNQDSEVQDTPESTKPRKQSRLKGLFRKYQTVTHNPATPQIIDTAAQANIEPIKIQEKNATLQRARQGWLQIIGSIEETCKPEIWKDAISLNQHAQPRVATFFDERGQNLTSPTISEAYQVHYRFSMDFDMHMPHFKLGIRRKDLRQAPKESIAKDNQLDLSAEYEADPTESVHRFVALSITPHSLEDAAIFDLRDESKLSSDTRSAMNTWSQEMHDTISTLREDGKLPFVVALHFDNGHTRNHRLHLKVPQWAQRFATYVTQVGTNGESCFIQLNIVMSGEDQDPELFGIIHEVLREYKDLKHGSLQKFHIGQAHRPMYWPLDDNIDIDAIKEPADFNFHAVTSFTSMTEYLTVMTVNIAQQHATEKANIENFISQSLQVKLVEIPGRSNVQYFGYFIPPFGTGVRLREGTKLQLHFPDMEDHWDLEGEDQTFWSAEVTSVRALLGPFEYVAVTITRAWQNSTQTWDTREVTSINPRGIGRIELHELIKNSEGNKFNIKIQHPDKTVKNLHCAIENLGFEAADNQMTPWNHRMSTAVVSRRLDLLKPKDIFAAVRNQFDDIATCMKLNTEQRTALESGHNAAGGILLIQGPPGTGKTHIIKQFCRPFFLAQQQYPVMIIAPTNSSVDAIASGFNKMLHEDQAAGRVPEERYVLRVHSKDSEKQIYRADAEASRKIPEASRLHALKQLEDVIDIEELADCAMLVHSKFKDETARKYKGIYDKRVQLLELSVGMKMLEIAGTVRGPSTDPDASRYFAFRNGLRRYAGGEDIDEKNFGASALQLHNDALKGASLIVATTANGGTRRILDPIREHLRLLMVDEAAHEREENLLPYFAARFTAIDGIVLVGDFLQMRPLVTHEPKDAIYVSQSGLSFMSRLIKEGFDVTELVEQQRMVEQLCNIANKITYGGKLITAESAKLNRRPRAQAFQKWSKQMAKAHTSALLIDVARSECNETLKNATKSRYNIAFVATATVILCDLLETHAHATIALLTGYNAQYQRYVQVVENLKLHNVKGIERVSVADFDMMQGFEFDFVILDILVDHNKPSMGFQSESRRMNVATTRAREGMIVLADCAAIRKTLPQQRDFVSQLFNELASYKTFYTVEKEDIDNCEFLAPESEIPFGGNEDTPEAQSSDATGTATGSGDAGWMTADTEASGSVSNNNNGLDLSSQW